MVKYDIEQIKTVSNVLDVISGYIPLTKNGANYVCCCPFHDEKRPSFTVNQNKNIYKCFGCGKTGNAIDFLIDYRKIELPEALKILSEKYNIEMNETEKPKINQFKKPVFKNNTNVSNRLIEWFKTRGISEKTLLELKVTEGLEWMPQTKKEENTIQFNYFLDNVLINTKFRDGKKNFKLVSGAELILYNLDSVKGLDKIIIVEGEIDCLTLHEAGFKNVISVPNGANISKNNLTYLDNSIDHLPENVHYILALDNDKPGINLRDELARRLGYENCSTVTFKDCKDANECLIKHGIEAIKESINQAKEYPIEGVFSANDIKQEIYDFYHNGLPPGCGIGMAEMDMHLKFKEGYITVITGIPGHGKSEFLDFLLCRLNISHGWKTALYSPENHPLELHFSKFAEKMTGKPFEGSHKMSAIDLENVINYHNENFYFINPEKDFTVQSILGAVRQLIRKKGIKAFVIDAWNKLDHKYTTTETKYISEVLDELAMFCEKNGVHLFLVAHPTKITKDKNTGLFDVPNLYSISGSANFYNKVANGLTVYINRDTNMVEIHIQKVKFKHWGKPGMIQLSWDYKNGRYYKGNPSYDNWLFTEESKPIEPNNDFLNQADITINQTEGNPF